MADQVLKNVATPGDGAAKKAAPSFTRTDKRSTTVKLAWPLEYDGVQYDEISVKRLTGKDILGVRKSAGDAETAMFALVCGVPTEVIEALDAEDMIRIVDVAQDFLPRGSETTEEQAGNTGASTPQT